MIRLALLLSVLAISASANAATLTVAPHLGELATDGFVIACETDTAVALVAEVAPRAADGTLGAYVKSAESSGARHRLRISGRAPRERLRWRLVTAGAVVAEGDAETAPPNDAAALDFLVYGDTRSDETAERATAIAAAAVAPLFALHTGDVAPTGDDDEAWHRFFDVEQPLLGGVPLYLAIGNHELYRDPEATRVRRYLPLPPNNGATYYTFRIGRARVIALDSNRPDVQQTEWLAKMLSAASVEPDHPHVFVFMHHPPFSTGGHCGSAVEQAEWIALFEHYLPTAVFAGHDHAYERLERNGVRYFVTGGGGAPVYGERERCPEHDRTARRVYRAEHHVLHVRVRGEAIEIEVVRPAGPPIEVVRWSRGDGLGAAGPALIDERRPTGLFRPLVTTAVVAALAGVLILWTRRRRGRAAGSSS